MRALRVVISLLFLGVACARKDEPAQKGSAAPGSSTTASTPADDTPGLDPCSLLTKAEVEAATQQKTTDPKPAPQPALEGYKPPAWPKYRTCIFYYASEQAVPLVTVGTTTHESADAARKMWDFVWKDNADIQKVAGVGDAAHWSDVGSHLEVLAGRYEIDINPEISTGDGDRDLSVGLGKQALTKLPR